MVQIATSRFLFRRTNTGYPLLPACIRPEYARKFLMSNARRFASADTTGFTIVELAVVLMVVGILASLALLSFWDASASAKEAKAAPLLSEVYTLQQTYQLRDNRFAHDFDELDGRFDMLNAANHFTFEMTASDTTFSVCAKPRGSIGLRHFSMNEQKQLKSQWWNCP
jgi:prepilin-type N-terminal cleavage/methylation domain-containing protein